MSVHPIYLPSGAKAKVKPKADLFPSIYKPRSEVEVEPKSVQESKVEIENQPASHTGTDTKARADQCIAEGKKAIALKQWEEGVNKYAEALDLMCVNFYSDCSGTSLIPTDGGWRLRRSSQKNSWMGIES